MMRKITVALLLSVGYGYADDLPRYFEMFTPECDEAFRIAASAVVQGSIDTRGNFDINIGEVKAGVRYPVTFTHAQLTYFWETQAAGKFVCLILEKNDLDNDVKTKYVRGIAEGLFACGVIRAIVLELVCYSMRRGHVPTSPRSELTLHNHMSETTVQNKAEQNGCRQRLGAVCRVSNVHPSPSPDPRRSAKNRARRQLRQTQNHPT